MLRRSFLEAVVALGVGRSLSWDVWVPAPDRLRAARDEAYFEVGLPLLVFLVPADEGERAALGRVWGAFFDEASPVQLADAALVRRVAASRDELDDLLGRDVASTIEAGAALVLLEPARPPRTVSRDELPPDCVRTRLARDGQHAAVAKVLAELVHPDAEALARHADRFSAVQVDRGHAAPSPEARALGESFARRRRAEAQRRNRAAVLHDTGVGLRDELRRGPIQRASWRVFRGGRELHPCVGTPCGTGAFPEEARRLLDFLVGSRSDRRPPAG